RRRKAQPSTRAPAAGPQPAASKRASPKWASPKWASPKRASPQWASPKWASLSDEQLLSLRFCDLKLSIEHSSLRRYVARLYSELESRGLDFQPHVWL